MWAETAEGSGLKLFHHGPALTLLCIVEFLLTLSMNTASRRATLSKVKFKLAGNYLGTGLLITFLMVKTQQNRTRGEGATIPSGRDGNSPQRSSIY